MSTTISPTSSMAAATAYAPGSSRVPMKTLGQDEFLKLLVTKMTSQDPMNPQGDSEFIGQMAQFSSLEQSKNMSNDIAALTASGLIGRNVTIKGDTIDGVQKADIKGTVSSISIQDGKPQVMVGTKEYDLDRISLITPNVPEIPATITA